MFVRRILVGSSMRFGTFTHANIQQEPIKSEMHKICIKLHSASPAVAMIFVGGGGTRPTLPSLASVVHTFEAVAESWVSVSAPAVSRVMSRAPEWKKIAKKR